jgi:hypothetical protein
LAVLDNGFDRFHHRNSLTPLDIAFALLYR